MKVRADGKPAAAELARPTVVALLVFAAGAALSFYAHLRLQRSDRAQLAARVDVAVQQRIRALQAATRSYEDVLHSLRTLYTYSDDVTYGEFLGSTADLIARYPGIGALEWAPLVKHSQRAAVEEWVRREVRPDFQFLNYDASRALVPATAAPEYMPLVHIQPLDPNQPALGFNLLTGTSHAEIAIARNEGRTMLSRVTRLFVAGSSTTGFVLYAPVFTHLPTPGVTPAPADFRGFLMAVFRLDQFFAESPDLGSIIGYDLLVVDRTARSTDGVIALQHEDGRTQISDLPTADEFITPLAKRIPFPIWGRDWEIIIRPGPAWIQSATRRQPYLVLFLGIMVSGAISLLLFGRLRYTASMEREVADRTAELHAAQIKLEADIRRRIKAEEALAASEERYRVFVSQSAEAIWRCELRQPLPLTGSEDERIDHIYAHGYLAECNDAMARMYGFSQAIELVGAKLSDLQDASDPRNRAMLRAFIQSGFRLQEVETHETDRNGKSKVFINSLVGICEDGKLVRAWGTQRDVTAQRQAEAERSTLERKLQETQKLESLGVLAGGIAHDFNNLLTGILGNAGLVDHGLPPSSPLQAHVREIEAASMRAAELCKQMLAYSGKGRFLVEPIDLSRLVQDTVPLLRLSISKSARLHFRLDPAVPTVIADATQMRQILMNLVINASDALGGQLGDITVTTGAVHADKSMLRQAVLSPSIPDGTYAFLEVTDTGCGMSPATQARIFDPFFTTKFAGRGLGLAAVLGIVRGHNGALFLKSAPGQGSSFRLLLPPADPSQKPSAPAKESRSPWSRSGRALLVDDEDSVRFVGSHMLQAFGLTVDVAANGEEAIAKFENTPDYDIVILDLTMPGIGGEEVLARIRQIRPETRVILMSGFSEQEIAQRLGPNPPIFVQKPFTVETMRSHLKRTFGS